MSTIKREWFENDESFQAFVLASSSAARLQQYLDDGYTVLDNSGNTVRGGFYTDISGVDSTVYEGASSCRMLITGDTHSAEDHLIWEEMAHIKRHFSEYKIIKPTDSFSLEM